MFNTINLIIVTPNIFFQSLKSYKTGDKGFCKLASMSTGNAIYDLGFWFEFITNNGRAMIFTVYINSWTRKKPDRKTLLINELSQLSVFMDDVRQNAQNELNSFLLCHDCVPSCIQLDLNSYWSDDE